MRKMTQLSKILFLALAFTIVVSCSTDDSGNSTATAAEGTITAKVDGQTLTSATLLTQASVATGQFSLLAMQGTNMNGDGFSFSISGFDGVGTYEVGGSNSVFAVCTYIDSDLTNPTQPNLWTGQYDEAASVGQFIVTEATDTNIKGTFSFKGKNPNGGSIKDITEGSFNVALTSF